jgi:hypothetical protein
VQFDTRAMLRNMGADSLIALLTMEDGVQREMMDEIARRGESMVEALAQAIEDDSTWELDLMPLHAACGLCATGSPSAVQPIVEAIRRASRSDSDPLSGVGGGLFNKIGPACFEEVLRAFRAEDHPRASATLLSAMVSLSLLEKDLQPLVIREVGEALRGGSDPGFALAARLILADYLRSGREKEVLEALGLGCVDEDPGFAQLLIDAEEGEAFAALRVDPLDRYPDTVGPAQASEAEVGDYLRAREGGERRDAPKVGRNAPCPCGSGRKHKKCCLRR